MYSGQVAQITNSETWVSDFIQIVDVDAAGAVLNILNPDIGFTATAYIRTLNGDERLTGTVANGKMALSSGPDGPGIQFVFSVADTKQLEAGTYRFGLKTVANGATNDLIVGTLNVTEGFR